MRPGEAIALSKDDVHITNNNASVVINGTMMYRERSIADMKNLILQKLLLECEKLIYQKSDSYLQ